MTPEKRKALRSTFVATYEAPVMYEVLSALEAAEARIAELEAAMLKMAMRHSYSNTEETK